MYVYLLHTRGIIKANKKLTLSEIFISTLRYKMWQNAGRLPIQIGFQISTNKVCMYSCTVDVVLQNEIYIFFTNTDDV